jgi:uncharacterized repeat protein (TIGR03803 family)
MAGPNGRGTVFKINPGGKLTTLYSFCSVTNSEGDCLDGAYPSAGLVQATDGAFYGTTGEGGANDYGTVFKINPEDALTTLYNFCSQLNDEGVCTDGRSPAGGLVLATNGNFYGTTYGGGAPPEGLLYIRRLWHGLQNQPRRHTRDVAQIRQYQRREP